MSSQFDWSKYESPEKEFDWGKYEKKVTPHGPRDVSSFQTPSEIKNQTDTSLGEKVKNYFTSNKFGEALAIQRKTGGFAGGAAPALYPEEARNVATEVATMAAVEAAYAPIIGWAQASKAPRTLEALTRLTQAGTAGAATATTGKLVEEGELPSPEELLEEGATWVAIDAAMQAAHLTVSGGKKAYDIGKAINSISKKEKIPVTQVLKDLWDSTKNYLGQRFGRTINSPSDILPADAEVLTDRVKQIEQRVFGHAAPEAMGSEVPPETPQEPSPLKETPTHEYLPEEQKLTAPQEFLKSDYEIAEDIRSILSPLNQESEKLPDRAIPRTVNMIFEPVQEELDSVSPARVNDPNFIGNEVSRAVKRVSKEIYQENSKLWDRAEDLASEEINPRPELANSLRSIIEESPSRPAAGEAKLQNFAEDLLARLEKRKGKRVGYPPISNAQLIKEIKQARASGYDYRYSGGVQSHRLNEFMNAVEQELIRSSSEESRSALLQAREAHKNWAIRFKDPSVLPFRKEGLEKPQSLYNKFTTPDTFNVLSDILSQDRRGRYLMQLTARNMVEKALEPYLMRPQSFNPVRFEESMGKLKGIVPDEMISSIGQKLYQLHDKAINKPQVPVQTTPSFASITEGQISSKLRTIEGLRELKKQLEKVPGGADKYREIAGTMGIDLLFGGQMDVPANSDRIKKMINDRNGRPYIKETLGEDNLKVLDDLVKKNSLEKRLTEIKESPTLSSMVTDPDILIKGGKLLWHILKGNPISVITNARSIHKRLSKKIVNKENKKVPDANINIQ